MKINCLEIIIPFHLAFTLISAVTAQFIQQQIYSRIHSLLIERAIIKYRRPATPTSYGCHGYPK